MVVVNFGYNTIDCIILLGEALKSPWSLIGTCVTILNNILSFNREVGSTDFRSAAGALMIVDIQGRGHYSKETDKYRLAGCDNLSCYKYMFFYWAYGQSHIHRHSYNKNLVNIRISHLFKYKSPREIVLLQSFFFR